MEYLRSQQVREASSFLSIGGLRCRAVLVRGPSGIGKSTFIDHLHTETLAAGCSQIIVIDDAQDYREEQVSRLLERLSSDTRLKLLVAGIDIPEPLMQLINNKCVRRLIELQPLEDSSARALLADMGEAPWTFAAQQVLRASEGNPRVLIDHAQNALDLSNLPPLNKSTLSLMSQSSFMKRLSFMYVNGTGQVESLVEQQRALLDQEECTPSQRADALVTCAHHALVSSDLEAAVELGERAASCEEAEISFQLLGASIASTARMLRGEPTAILSLHSLAGRASRAKLVDVEAIIWQRIAWCSSLQGDVVTAIRHAVRGIELADADEMLLLQIQGRSLLAELHVAAGEHNSAICYLNELMAVADKHSMYGLKLNTASMLARVMIAIGRTDQACQFADEALEIVARANSTHFDAVDTAVTAARAYALAGSTELALAPLQAISVNLADSHSPDFWVVLEAIRVLGRARNNPALFKEWQTKFALFDFEGHGGALRAAHAEVDAWGMAVQGRRAEAARLAERAKVLWLEAECHEELSQLQPIIDQAPLEHSARISIVANPAGPPRDPEAFSVLTKREREIARYVAGGLTNPEIASELHLSPRTVEHHVASILRKLELPSRRALVRGRV